MVINRCRQLLKPLFFVKAVEIWLSEGLLVGLAGTAWLIAVAVALVVAAAIVLNWADPNPGVFISDVGAGAEAFYELVAGAIADWLSGVVGA